MRRGRYRRVYYNPWKEPTYADSTLGDFIDGEDLDVRRAAVEALGPLNGSVVVTEAHSGRILTVVNQRSVFGPGYTPCSTIKIFVGMAGLSEGVMAPETQIPVSRRRSMNLSEALARSDNPYFAYVGQRLGFERVSHYARMFGLGERATLGLDEETVGALPPYPPANGGVGMMSSFGEGIRLTPLQLAAAMGAIANGGTLHYLQYPKSREEAARLAPRVKRRLDIRRWIQDVRPGLLGAVEEGTARRAGYDQDDPILGKTGTCTDRYSPTHLGWFASFNEVRKKENTLTVVVLLTGGRPINGPVASGVAGRIYRSLSDQGFFDKDRQLSPIALVQPQVELD